MTDKTQPGLTFSILEITDTIKRKYDEWHNITFYPDEQVFICDNDGDSILAFNNLTELHLWVAKTCIELDEQETEQSAANDKINAESAKVDIFKQQF